MNRTHAFLNRRAPAAWLCGLLALTLTLSACQGLPTRTGCPSAQDMSPDMLHGTWTVQITGEPLGTLTLGPHPEHVGSLRGEWVTATASKPRAVVADLDDGEFTLEETHDGQRIAATWLGSLPKGACGRQIQGQRTTAGQDTRPFVLTRQP